MSRTLMGIDVIRRLFSFVFGIGIGVGLGATVMHRVDKAAQAAAEKASPAFFAKKLGSGAATMVNRVGEGWRETRVATDDVPPVVADEFTVRSARRLRAG